MSTITAPPDEVPQFKDRPRYYRLGDLAKIWGRHPSAFTRDILRPKTDKRTGETFTLEAIRTPRSWLVPEGAVERYFARLTASRMSTPAPHPAEATAARQRERARIKAELTVGGY